MDGVPTFMEQYCQGRVSADDIDDFIDRWHDAPPVAEGRVLPLHEFLGMTREQYEAWVHDVDVLPSLIRDRLKQAS